MKNKLTFPAAATLRPYGVIALAALLAYLPVSSMLFTLRNDVLAIEYPIQHFMSECLRNGQFPGWFNTWSMGFPLQTILTWGVYSTPQMLTGFLFESNIYVLHAEFLFFIMASGWCMFKLLKTHFLSDRNLSLLLSCCYMLSGFTVGSSQWLLYITGMTFIPLCLYFLLSLLKKPSFKYSLLFAVSFYLFFTNVHIYLTVISSYAFAFFLAVYFTRLFITRNRNKQDKVNILCYTALALLFTAILCAAPAYYTVETVSLLERSLALDNDSVFFQSNYLHPDGLSSFLLPLSSVKTTHFNTEGTVMDVYIGLLPLILLPLSLSYLVKRKNKTAVAWLAASLFFLLISFGHLTPLRGWLNILPGMGHFRHPGVLRMFFNITFIIFLATCFKDQSLSTLLSKDSPGRKWILYSAGTLLLLSLLALLLQAGNIRGLWKGTFYETVKTMSNGELVLVSAAVQVFFTGLLLYTIARKHQLFYYLLLAELIVNTLICTPFFTISTYRAKEVAAIMKPVKGFPVQQRSPFDIPAVLTDSRNNSWHNVNTYRKEVSNNVSMPGPLILEKVSIFISAGGMKHTLEGKDLVFLKDSIQGEQDSIRVTEQLPAQVSAELFLSAPGEIILQQAAFPGWKAFYNGKPLPLLNNDQPFVSVKVPAGRGKLVFKFEKNGVLLSAFALHLVVLLTGGWYFSRKFFIRSSSLS